MKPQHGSSVTLALNMIAKTSISFEQSLIRSDFVEYMQREIGSMFLKRGRLSCWSWCFLWSQCVRTGAQRRGALLHGGSNYLPRRVSSVMVEAESQQKIRSGD